MEPIDIKQKSVVIAEDNLLIVSSKGGVNSYHIPEDCKIVISNKVIEFIPVKDDKM